MRLINQILLASVSIYLLGCVGPSRSVQRVASDKQTDISGHWNDTDARMTAEYMVRELLTRNWLPRFKDQNERIPILVVGRIGNKTSEHLNTSVFIKEIEKELVNSGEVQFVASATERTSVRDERMDQQSYASMESAKELANEQAADYMLRGEITSVEDRFEGQRAILYKVSLELIEIENNVKVWIGNKDIKKFIQQDRYKW